MGKVSVSAHRYIFWYCICIVTDTFCRKIICIELIWRNFCFDERISFFHPVKSQKHSMEDITEIHSHTFLAKISWRYITILQIKLLNSWFDEFFSMRVNFSFFYTELRNSLHYRKYGTLLPRHGFFAKNPSN